MIREKMFSVLFSALCFSLVLTSSPAPLVAAEEELQELPSPWILLAGYGFSHPGLGNTRKWVETVDLIGRYEFDGGDELGRSWYQGRYIMLLELPLHFVVDPGANPMVGVNFLASYRLTSLGELQPYGFVGGGPLYSASKIDGMGSHWNGNWQWGVGLQLPLTSGHDLKFEYRFHHISNGGRSEPNDPLNSSKLLVGMSF